VPENSFGDVWVADKVWETVPGGQTSKAKSPVAVCA